MPLLHHAKPRDQQQPQGPPLPPRPPAWYEAQPGHRTKLIALAGLALATLAIAGGLLLALPVSVGRALLAAAQQPNGGSDLLAGALGAATLWGVGAGAAAAASTSATRGTAAAAAAARRWTLLLMQAATLLLLWLGVVATLAGLLCERLLLPLLAAASASSASSSSSSTRPESHAADPATAGARPPLLALYQAWALGVLALQLAHLTALAAPRGAAPLPGTWRAQLDALHAGGLRRLNFGAVLRGLVLPVAWRLSACLVLPYALTHGALPLLQLPRSTLDAADLYGHSACLAALCAWRGAAAAIRALRALHDSLHAERYLVGRRLNDFAGGSGGGSSGGGGSTGGGEPAQ
jgi:hypothetical protein